MPTTFLGGRYRLEDFLGEGANKAVYRARDTVLERDVAFALIKREGWGFWKEYPAGMERILKEARFMARLGDHPNIVAVYDAGEEDGYPFMVSQLMTGGDLESLLAGAPRGRLSVDRALDITDQLLSGLAWAHGHDVIHRDLKPGNVWIDEEGTAKIGDLGLAMGIDRSTLSTRSAIVGTVAYMAPEQATGGMPDERSDIYSVGCILYAMLTGRPPFVSDDTVAVIDQHVSAPPVAPSWHNSAIPKSVDRLVCRLLAKDSDLRPQTAVETRTDVATVRWTLGAERSALDVEPTDANPLNSLAPRSFVGRLGELAALRSAIETAPTDGLQAVYVSGEPGIGKTRLAEQAAVFARLGGFEVLWGRNREGATATYHMWGQVLGSALDLVDAGVLQRTLGPAYGDVARVVPEIRRRYPDLPPSPPLDADQARRRLHESIFALMAMAVERHNLVLILEDLHWADQASLELLGDLVAHLKQAPAVVVGTYRNTELTPEAHRLLDRASAAGVELRLEGLTGKEVSRFLSVMAGWDADENLAAELVDLTGGNPFLMTEVVRLFLSGGSLPDASAEGAPDVPPSVRELFQRRLDHVSREVRQVLRAAAVVGHSFGVDLLTGVTGMSEGEVGAALSEAAEARIIQMEAAGGDGAFLHSLLQSQVYSDIPAAERTRLHARTGRVLEHLHSATGEARASDIAHHYFEGLDEAVPEDAARFALMAGNESLEAYAFEDAARHFSRVLDMQWSRTLPPRPLAALHEGLGDALVALARRERGVQEYEQAATLLLERGSEQTDDRPDHASQYLDLCSPVLLKLAMTYLADRRFPEAFEALDLAEACLEGRTEGASKSFWSRWIPIVLSRGEAYYHAGDLRALAELIDQITPRVEEHGTTDQRGDLLGARVRLGLRSARYRPGEQVADDGREELALRIIGKASYGGLGAAHFRLGFTLVLQGDYAEGLRNLEAALSLAGRIGDRIQAARCAVYISMGHRLAGDEEQARRRAEEGVERSVDADQPGYAAAAKATRGWALLRGGHPHEAERDLEQALDDWGPHSTWPFEWLARWPLAALAEQRGDTAAALSHIERMLDPSQQAPPHEVEEAMRGAIGKADHRGVQGAIILAQNHGLL